MIKICALSIAVLGVQSFRVVNKGNDEAGKEVEKPIDSLTDDIELSSSSVNKHRKGGKGDDEASTPAEVASTPAEVEECPGTCESTPRLDKASVPTDAEYDAAVDSLDMDAVKADMATLLKTSQPCWPADQGNYAGLMIRLAWHCSGSYRNEDGAGGCTGGRLRFEPERSWPDNTNLDKARALLSPLKRKYGDALSWGDLFILAGTTAYREAGMPVSRMCFGRKDEPDGKKSVLLGPTAEQEKAFPCQPGGDCGHPLPTSVGLIYVNPEGPGGVPNASASVKEIRRTFATMGHSDEATVALIGGGHAIGKSHGACPNSPGNPPNVAFQTGTPIWRGECGSGIGRDTQTSGIEGYWTSKPFQWDNEFFVDLFTKKWELWEGPGGAKQWRVMGEAGPGGLMRLTTDLALLEDPSYKYFALKFAKSQYLLNRAFDKAWDLLTSRGAGVWSSKAKCDDGSNPPTTSTLMRDDDAGH